MTGCTEGRAVDRSRMMNRLGCARGTVLRKLWCERGRQPVLPGMRDCRQKSSCCGCTCVVFLLIVPVAALMLHRHGGVATAAVAIPAWIPAAHILDLASHLAHRGVDGVRAILYH